MSGAVGEGGEFASRKAVGEISGREEHMEVEVLEIDSPETIHACTFLEKSSGSSKGAYT